MRLALPSRPTSLLAAVALTCVAMTPVAGVTTSSHEDPPGDDEDEVRVTSAEGVTEDDFSGSVVERMEVETSWGTLRGELRRPLDDDGEPLTGTPVILQVSPYGILNEGLSTYDDINRDATANYFVPRGYAYGIFDAIGTHASGGCTDFGGLPERESTAELVDAIGSLPWTNGKVGMIGASYDGTLAIAAAVEAPEHLAAIIPQVAIDRWYDYMYANGVRMFLEDSSGRGGAIPADPPGDSPTDYDVVYGVVPDHTQDPQTILGVAVESVTPCNQVEHQVRGNEPDPEYDQFWIDRDYRALASEVTAAVLFEGAWLDDNVKHEAGPYFIGALPEDTPKHLVMGQWTHATSRFSDAMDLRHAWFDQYLYGHDTGVDHLYTYSTQTDDGLRRMGDHWPPEHTVDEVVTLYSPDFTWGDPGAGSWMDGDKTLIEERLVDADCAPTFCDVSVGPTATEAYRVAGTPVLELDIITSTTHLAPVLIEVLPDGTREIVARGFLDTRNRNGLDRTEPHDLEAFTVSIEMWPLDIVVEPGGHLELVLASTNLTFGVPDVTTVASPIVREGRLHLPITDDLEVDRVELFTIDDVR